MRHRPPTTQILVEAVLASPLIHELATVVPHRRVGRTARHPVALHLAWAVLARGFGSGNRLDAEIARSDLWPQIIERYNESAAAHPDGVLVSANIDRLYADTHRHTRDRFCEPDNLDRLTEAFTAASVDLARDIGLLNSTTRGSRTHPNALNAIYGDGTILRPIYRGDDGHRSDPDAVTHHRHDGTVVGTKLVHFAVRGPEPHRRIMLAVGHVPEPGREAEHSVGLIRRIHQHAGDGISAVVYDGAFRGTHHHEIMTDLGVVVVNKPHGTRSNRPRTLTLGTWTHSTRAGECEHALVAHGGNVCDATLDDAGNATLSDPLERAQVRRYERPDNRYRFSLGVKVRCAAGNFTAWISPHPGPGDTTAGRADQLRLISPHEPRFDELYGLRNDSEAINANYKSTHVYDRAPVLGWRRQLLDLLAWSILNNATAWWHHAPSARALRMAA